MIATDLLPCPFCGNAPAPEVNRHFITRRFFIWCLDCDIAGPERKTEQEAVDAWNSRAVTAKQLD